MLQIHHRLAGGDVPGGNGAVDTVPRTVIDGGVVVAGDVVDADLDTVVAGALVAGALVAGALVAGALVAGALVAGTVVVLDGCAAGAITNAASGFGSVAASAPWEIANCVSPPRK